MTNSPTMHENDREVLLEDGHGAQDWAAPLCDIFGQPGGCSLCLWSFFCNPCLFGQSYALAHDQAALMNGTEPCTMVCTGPCWMQALIISFFKLPCILPACLRSQVRAKHNIMGNDTKCMTCWSESVDDFCVSLWCAPCASMQVYKTLKREEARQLANSLEMTEMATLPPMTGKQLHSDEYTASPETSSSGVSYPPPSSYNQSPM